MRTAIFMSLALVAAAGLVTACNSKDSVVSQASGAPSPSPGATAHNPADDARRITAQELYELYQKDKVLIVDTRTEPSYKESHIKGAILIPAGDFANKADELPRDKMIVAYCT